MDDSVEDRAVIRMWLASIGQEFEVFESETVDAGITAFKARNYSCVFLDYTFPQSSAYEFLEKIKDQTSDRLQSPVIVITARGNEETIVKCMKAGAIDYINKDRLSEPGHVAEKIVERVIREHSQLLEIERSQHSEKKALANALKSQEELAHSIDDLRKAKLSADAANVSKSAFLANMSHEIRSPLTSILGFTQLLKDAKLSSELKEFVLTIERNGQHLLSVINEILDFSKVESGKVSLSYSEFDVRELISDLLSNFTRVAKAKGVNLRVFFHPDFPTRVISDPTRVRQILTNLLSNSVKFTNRGEIAVIAQGQSDGNNTGSFSLVVSDSGEGINKLDAAKLFKRFGQANDSISARFGGTGLGLVLSKKLANLLGGDLELVSSEPGVGSLFKLQLPIQGAASQIEKRLPDLSPIDANALSDLSILVVDDSSDNRFLLRRMLGKFGAKVTCLNDGVEAVEEAREIGADIVVMDVQMPNLDGHEAARLLRKAGYITPIIGLTAHALPEDRRKSERAGFNTQLTKPIDTHALVKAILCLVHKNE